MKRFTIGLVSAAVLGSAAVAEAGWQDWLGKAQQYLEEKPEAASAASAIPGVSGEEAVSALKEALKLGAERAVARLGREGGYQDDAGVSIPMPAMLKPVEAGLRKLGQGQVADAFVSSINRAAERAAPEATAIFAEAAAGMSVEDAWGILKGADDAATGYFRQHTGTQLKQALLPIVREATAEAQVTAAYKKLLEYAGPYLGFIDPQRLDLDAYVTDGTLEGLFVRLAEEEKRIREQPAARTSELLEKVFGAL